MLYLDIFELEIEKTNNQYKTEFQYRQIFQDFGLKSGTQV